MRTQFKKTFVYRDIPRISADDLGSLRDLTLADLHDALPSSVRAVGLLHERMRPVSAGQRMYGQAVTAFCAPGDSLMSHCALYVAQPGDVLVISNGGVSRGALWGATMALDAKVSGVAGVIVDGPIRDIAAIRELGLPVWTTSVSASRADKIGEGSVNAPVACGGSIVNPGDVVIANDDGVLVFSPEYMTPAVAAVRRKLEEGADVQRRIAGGERIFDVMHFNDLVEAKGIQFRDGHWRP